MASPGDPGSKCHGCGADLPAGQKCIRCTAVRLVSGLWHGAVVIAYGLWHGVSVHRFISAILRVPPLAKAYGACCFKNLLILGIMLVAQKTLQVIGEQTGFSDVPGVRLFVQLLIIILIDIPLYMSSLLKNMRWYTTILDEANKDATSRGVGKAPPRPSPAEQHTWGVLLDTVQLTLLTGTMVVFPKGASFIIRLLPRLLPPGQMLTLWAQGFCNNLSWLVVTLFGSWLCAFDAIDALYRLRGEKLRKSINYFEGRWLYFLAFGLPLYAATMVAYKYLGYFGSCAAYAVLLPGCAVIQREVDRKKASGLPQRLPIFGIPWKCTDWLFKQLKEYL
eukprot:TRINITY_DN6129_c0_g1_i2.p1 TRINITY_DN6129_c0_g1~~TRINITY_DN6129_c0_g1_i2.p1  ORF type:complete len:362 (+),score=101.56 TRINITY_DN6129_c0_g1_i2:86-1087(+)